MRNTSPTAPFAIAALKSYLAVISLVREDAQARAAGRPPAPDFAARAATARNLNSAIGVELQAARARQLARRARS